MTENQPEQPTPADPNAPQVPAEPLPAGDDVDQAPEAPEAALEVDTDAVAASYGNSGKFHTTDNTPAAGE